MVKVANSNTSSKQDPTQMKLLNTLPSTLAVKVPNIVPL
jgi:hypothetical protein